MKEANAMYELLKLLEENARYSDAELAVMLDTTEEEVKARIADYERSGALRGYRAIVDWEKTEQEPVFARVELKVTPKKDRGFEDLARYISGFPEVQSLYLMSGGYDLAVTLAGQSFKEIASFVAYRLAPLDSVQATATHFVLRKYKDKGVILADGAKEDGRVPL
jgi:DNA-binding Lrp family transcriptional regulator